MKTLKILIILFFISLFAANNVKAQNGVIKEEIVIEMPAQYLECTGDWVWGDILVENMFMPNNYVFKVKNADVKGYTDETHKIESGNVYELSQTVPGLTFMENTGTFKLNGKVIAVFHFDYHITINANGVVTQEHSTFRTDCK
jgi:hypothetical protein